MTSKHVVKKIKPEKKTDWMYLVYDKFAGDHSFGNSLTKEMKIDNIVNLDLAYYTCIEDENAVEFFNNRFTGVSIPPLDKNTYKVKIFVSKDDSIEYIYTIIGINTTYISDIYKKNSHVLTQDIPNFSFFKLLCTYNISYNNIIKQTYKVSIDTIVFDIINTIMSKASYNDQPIKPPDEIKATLFQYQRKTINWMLQKERNPPKIYIDTEDKIIMNDLYFDTQLNKFEKLDKRTNLTFFGGGLIDEVGLGKTLQITTLSVLNPAINISPVQAIDPNRFFSRATLVICPTQLCGQWKREFEKFINPSFEPTIITILTKVHFEKYSYQDLIEADFVIVSYTFLENQCYIAKWLGALSTTKNYHKATYFDATIVSLMVEKRGQELMSDPFTSIDRTEAMLHLIRWHRIVVDEFHEIYTVNKYHYIENLLPFFKASYKWCVTGTPFEKNIKCLRKMVDFMTDYNSNVVDDVFTNNLVKNYLTDDCFRRHTKKSVKEEFTLPPLKEEVIWLKFSQTERMMYNAYLANPNNEKFSTYLRQLCCHPKLADETKFALSNCKTLKDIQKMMVEYYEGQSKESFEKVEKIQTRIKKLKKKIKKIVKKQKNKNVNLDLGPFINIDDVSSDEDDDDKDDDDYYEDDTDSDDSDGDSDDDDDNRKVKVKKHNYNNNVKKLVSFENFKDSLITAQDKLKIQMKDYDGKKTTFNFYKNVVDRIKRTVKSDDVKPAEKIENTDGNNDFDMMNKISNDLTQKDEEEEICGICLGEIPEDDIGVTECGHMFCYQCVKTMLAQKHKCPCCQKGINTSQIYYISYEVKKKNKEESKEAKTKEELIDNIGTKLANLVLYIKKTNKHTILFSQWDDLLMKVGKTLNENGVKNVFCKGNVWQRDKAIRDFNSQDTIKVIMLSSESAASGTNLTKASEVILLDPVYGEYEKRKNTEGQAIGRAYRLGQKNEVKIVRFVIKDTIEEEIYNMNAIEDKKLLKDIIQITELEDSQIQ